MAKPILISAFGYPRGKKAWRNILFMLFSLCLTGAAQAAIPSGERQVLLDLYNATNGAKWTNNAGWGGDQGTECTWHGVYCDGAKNHVIQILLSNNNLVGPLPSISGLIALEMFIADINQLTGSIPPLNGMAALEKFSVGANHLTGAIPSLNGLIALQWFEVSGNQLTGSIPSLEGLAALNRFLASNNKLTGTIPSLSGLPLRIFNVQGNLLTGSVPAAPATLVAKGSFLCDNSLTSSSDPAIDAAWVAATGVDWLACQTAASLFTLSATRSGTGEGKISSNIAGISCGTSCWADYASGITVTLTATPASGSYFHGWSGACSGSGSCMVIMNAAKNVTAIFKPTPFIATTSSNITATSATISTTISFNSSDAGKQGSVYVTAWAPANGLGTLGISTAQSKGLSVVITRDSPYGSGKVMARQELLFSALAAADASSAFVLVQLTPSGWQLVANGELIPYASGVLGDSMAALNLLNNANPASLPGTQFCVGYGTSAAEMVAAGRMMPVADITSAVPLTNGSCNVAVNPYKGLWYNASEPGWGMSVTQHDNINFVALYTYNQSAEPVWYVMSSCPLVTAGSCSGEIYQVTGGSMPISMWAPNLGVSAVGRGTLTFSDASHGKFDFTLNGVTGSKTIQRQQFASGTPAQAVDYSDLWWNADESGWGVSLTQDAGMIFAAWYTYDASGNPVWYVASSCPLSDSSCSGDIYRVTGGAAPTSPWAPNLTVTPVGSVSFAFSDSSTGTMIYTINGVSGTKAITRQAF